MYLYVRKNFYPYLVKVPKGSYQCFVLHFIAKNIDRYEGEKEKKIERKDIDTENIEFLNKLFALMRDFQAPVNVGRHFR